MKKKVVSVGMLLVVILLFAGCTLLGRCFAVDPPRTFLEEKYPGASGMYQYAGFTLVVQQEDNQANSLYGEGFEPTDIFNAEYSSLEQQEIHDYLVEALEFTGREIELTSTEFSLKNYGTTNYRLNFTNTGFELIFISDVNSPIVLDIIPAGILGKAAFEYDSVKKESTIIIYFTYSNSTEITVLFSRS